jgi:SAM-dependent methyltransferase
MYEPPQVDAASLSKDERLRLLEAQVAFLLDEVSGLRSLMRHVAADKMNDLPLVRQTRESFDYQWRHLPEGASMLSNPAWKATVTSEITKFTRLDPTWFSGRRVLDAGCGQGRWTYGFGRLGAGHVVAVDVSPVGLERTKAVAGEFGTRVEVLRRNLLEPLGVGFDFDLAWCFGVLHHTGDTYRGFRHVVECVKPGGYLFLMLYAEPRRDQVDDYRYYHEIFDMRTRLRNLPFEEKVARLESRYGRAALHGYFDAISPEVNDLYRWDEIESWLLASGFDDVQRTMDVPNHYVIARRKS